MKEIIGFCQFCDRFRDMDRNDNFSYEGKKALFEYLEQIEEECETEIELDVIALCCEYTEYADLKEFQNAYSKDYESLEDIVYNTTVIRIEDSEGFIVSDF